MDTDHKPKRGRPPGTGDYGKLVNFRVSEDVLRDVDAECAKVRTRFTRSMMFRMLIEEALAARRKTA
jgi:hypothetical protein